LIRKSILQICVPELVDRARLSQHLPRQGSLKHWHEPHWSSLQEKRDLREQQR
jgi:hypothetical protein